MMKFYCNPKPTSYSYLKWLLNWTAVTQAYISISLKLSKLDLLLIPTLLSPSSQLPMRGRVYITIQYFVLFPISSDPFTYSFYSTLFSQPDCLFSFLTIWFFIRTMRVYHLTWFANLRNRQLVYSLHPRQARILFALYFFIFLSAGLIIMPSHSRPDFI